MNDAVIAEMPAATRSREPLTIRMHERDNVAIVANDGGLPPGAVLSSGLTLRDRVPQGHKVALVDLPADAPVLALWHSDRVRAERHSRRQLGSRAAAENAGCARAR